MDFEINRQYMYNNDIQNSKIIRYKPNNLATMNTVNNFNILISREESFKNTRILLRDRVYGFR